MNDPKPMEPRAPTVLLVEDSEASIERFRTALQGATTSIRTAVGLSEALQSFRGSREHVDVVVVDIRLDTEKPNRDGLVFAEFLRDYHPDLPIIAHSGFDDVPPALGGVSVPNPFYRAVRTSGDHAEGISEMVDRVFREHQSRLRERYRSVFISYGGEDQELATEIDKSLRNRGVTTWFFPRDAMLGQRLHRTMSEGVQNFDRVLLICSESSLKRSGVLNEIEQVLAREAREGGAELLIPVSSDTHVYTEWAPERPDLARQIRSRVIGDVPPVSEEKRFSGFIGRLLTALER